MSELSEEAMIVVLVRKHVVMIVGCKAHGVFIAKGGEIITTIIVVVFNILKSFLNWLLGASLFLGFASSFLPHLGFCRIRGLRFSRTTFPQARWW